MFFVDIRDNHILAVAFVDVVVVNKALGLDIGGEAVARRRILSAAILPFPPPYQSSLSCVL